ncbi:MAG: tRNA uridine-5-carboxymethylaminomethyl(34) synthesis GTPase MnmE [Candidatus Scalindua sp.]|nr:tRNA uridine-5-carboxymethylaminomethyl(34) synthesis GTPase MnmE [Candidatus Scalindua sp.]
MSFNLDDDIIAVSSPTGRSPRAIIKLSGKNVFRHVQKHFRSADCAILSSVKGFSSYQGTFHIEKEKILIPVSLFIMNAPNSYTREDVVEIHTFGSPHLLEMIFETLLLANQGNYHQTYNDEEERNMRLAEPGEFTKRAFLNGRINLAEAESVLRIIRAKTDSELMLAVSRLKEITEFMNDIQGELMKLCAEVEVAIDFNDNDIDIITYDKLESHLLSVNEKLNRAVNKNHTSQIPHDGVKTVFIGWPNAGKSSLFNKLLNCEKAIVTSIHGTTRDILEATVDWEGVSFQLTDTPGIMDGEGELESVIFKRTLGSFRDAHIVLFVIDGSERLQSEKVEFIESISDKNVIVVMNKTDLERRSEWDNYPQEMSRYSRVKTSALTGVGLEELKNLLVSTILNKSVDLSASGIIFSLRQKLIMAKVTEIIGRILESIQLQIGHEFVAIDLRGAVDSIGEITGEVATDDILDLVFKEFCIGK